MTALDQGVGSPSNSQTAAVLNAAAEQPNQLRRMLACGIWCS